MQQNRKDYETNSNQDDINEDPEVDDPFEDASGYDPAGELHSSEHEFWSLDDIDMDEELVREIEAQAGRDYMDYLSEDEDADEYERLHSE